MAIYLLCLALFSCGIYCVLRKRNIIKIIIGVIITEYAAHLFFILTAYRVNGRAPIYSTGAYIRDMVDPLPHALVLTLHLGESVRQLEPRIFEAPIGSIL